MNRTEYRRRTQLLRRLDRDFVNELADCHLSDDLAHARKEAYRHYHARKAELMKDLPVARDPLGFSIMAENWRIRRSHVLARVRRRRMERIERERAEMQPLPGESTLDFIDRKCGFVRDARYSTGRVSL